MSKLIATLVASLFAAAAFAQTGGVPPTVPAAGTNTKMEKKDDMMKKDDMKMSMSSDKKEARQMRHNKRVAKRVAQVGDKPVN